MNVGEIKVEDSSGQNSNAAQSMRGLLMGSPNDVVDMTGIQLSVVGE
jgi:hypothetical protein